MEHATDWPERLTVHGVTYQRQGPRFVSAHWTTSPSPLGDVPDGFVVRYVAEGEAGPVPSAWTWYAATDDPLAARQIATRVNRLRAALGRLPFHAGPLTAA